MKFSKLEVAAVEQAVLKEIESQARELLELELALVGGGQGDISLG